MYLLIIFSLFRVWFIVQNNTLQREPLLGLHQIIDTAGADNAHFLAGLDCFAQFSAWFHSADRRRGRTTLSFAIAFQLLAFGWGKICLHLKPFCSAFDLDDGWHKQSQVLKQTLQSIEEQLCLVFMVDRSPHQHLMRTWVHFEWNIILSAMQEAIPGLLSIERSHMQLELKS